MQQFFQALTAGLADGSIYASLALALVLIYKATEVINFAQGEMAMFTTYIAYALLTHPHFGHTLSYWPAFFVTLVIAFVFGVGLQRVVIKPLEHASVLTVVMATIALLVILNGLAAWIWSPELKFFPSPFPTSTWVVGGVHISKQDVGTFGVTIACVVVLWLFFRFTKLGLAMRARAVNPVAARLLGVRTSGPFRLTFFGISLIGCLGPNILPASPVHSSLDHGTFVEVGASATTILVVDHGWNNLLTLPVPGVAAGLAGLAFGLPATRFAGT